MEEQISIVVLTYNSGNTILDTLESIKSQSYNNLEIIICDDCSNDDTIVVIKEWLSNIDFKWKLITSKQNTGVAANANRGIKAATSDYIKLIAGDDLLEVGAIEVYYEYLKKGPQNVVWQSNISCFGEDCNRCKKFEEGMLEYGDFFELTSTEQYRHLVCKSKIAKIAAPSIGLLAKNVFYDVGLFDERLPLLEDYPFYLRLLKKGYVFRKINKPLVQYRLSESSITGSVSRKYYVCIYKCFFRYRFLPLIKFFRFRTLVKELIKCLFFLNNMHIFRNNDDKICIKKFD